MELLEQVDHELVAVVLHDRVKAPAQQAFQGGLDDPLFRTGRFIVDDGVEFMYTITKVEIVPSSRSSTFERDVVVVLHDEVVAQLPDRQQALQTGVHVAIECVIFEAYDTVFKVGQFAILFNHRIRLVLLLLLQIIDVSSVALRGLALFAFIDFLCLSHGHISDFDLPEHIVADNCWSTAVKRDEVVEEMLVDRVELRLISTGILLRS